MHSGKPYTVPDEMECTVVNTADFRSVSGQNSAEYRSKLGVNLSLSGSYSFFRMSVTNHFKTAQYRSRYRAFSNFQTLIRK